MTAGTMQAMTAAPSGAHTPSVCGIASVVAKTSAPMIAVPT